MKKISSTVRAPLLRSAVLPLLLVVICAIEFAGARRLIGAPATTKDPTIVCTHGWSAGPDLPSTAVRSVGVDFQNAAFYVMGGRSADSPGSDFTHPFEYRLDTNNWTTKSATYPDNQVNNMACGELVAFAIPYIYCVTPLPTPRVISTPRPRPSPVPRA